MRKGKATYTRRDANEDFGLLDVGEVTVVALDSADDVAMQKWGNGWRMPTCNELKELYDECEWQFTEQNGVKGYKVTGPNGNAIFLVGDENGSGAFWSCDAPVNSEEEAYGLSFNSFNPIYNRCAKYTPRNIRPVHEK